MSWIIGLASTLMSIYAVLIFHPFENEVVNAVIFPLLSIAYVALLCFANDHEYKLENRIEILEKKLEDKERGAE